MSTYLVFTMEVEVLDRDTFLNAGKERAMSEGADPTVVETIEDAAVMLFDPSGAPGCKITGSSAECPLGDEL